MMPRPALPRWLRRRLALGLAVPAPADPAARRRRLCLYKVDALGDFVLALGALHHLVDAVGPAACRLVVSTTAAPLAAVEFPGVDRWELPARAEGVWRELRPLRRAHAPQWAGEHFDALVCLRHQRNLLRDVTLGWLRANTWHGLGPRPTASSLAVDNRPVPVADYPAAAPADIPWCRELQAHLTVVASVAGRPVDPTAVHPVLRSVAATRGETVVVCPFGAEAIRDYPPAAWREAWRLAGPIAAPIEVLGPPERSGELAALADDWRALPGHRGITVTTGLSTPAFIARLAAARAIVTVESAAAHLATAFDKPAVILVGGGHHGWLAPWGARRRQHWLTHPLPCYGCRWVCTQPTVRCLHELPAAAVAAALRLLVADA